MVAALQVLGQRRDPLRLLEPLVTSVSLSDVMRAAGRLEASSYILPQNARQALQRSGLPLVPLGGAKGLARKIENSLWFPRIYVDAEHGVPFLPSGEVNSLRPRQRFQSRKHIKHLDRLLIQLHDVLLTSSGTIGNVGLAGWSHEGIALSDALRVRFEDPLLAGYVAGFLHSAYGRPQLEGASYGSVIVHLQPEHLERILVPRPAPAVVGDIGTLFLGAVEDRDRANELLDRADATLRQALGLPPLEELTRSRSQSILAAGPQFRLQVGPGVGPQSVTWGSCVEALQSRFEATFHDPVALEVEAWLRQLPGGTLRLGDKAVTTEIRGIGRFKRVYVPEPGIIFLSSTQLFQVDPIGLKYLGKGVHQAQLPELSLMENMLAVTCSGTIGRVQIIPKYMAGWAASQHSLRVIAPSSRRAAYLYAWLASDYGNLLIRRYTYGSVVPEIEWFMLAEVPVPLVPESVECEVADWVLAANDLRHQAWEKEREGHARIEELVTGGRGSAHLPWYNLTPG